MTVQERIEAIKDKGWKIAYDGCHKLYFLQTGEDEQDALDAGYDLYEPKRLQSLYDDACFLRFISNWGKDHEFDVDQCEDEPRGEE